MNQNITLSPARTHASWKTSRILHKMLAAARLLVTLAILLPLLTRASLPPADKTELIRAYTRNIEFDYVTGTVNALSVKWMQTTLGTNAYLPEFTQHKTVLEYLTLITKQARLSNQVTQVYSDPEVKNPQEVTTALRK